MALFPILIRGLAYFAIVFAAGFALGTVRVLYLLPRVGERTAELIETPLMFVVIVLAARFVVRRFPAPRSVSYAASGAMALALLLAIEFTLVLGLRGLTLEAYLASRDPVAGAVYVIMLLVFAAMPWFVGRKGQ